jgi:hypothetical protein
LQTGLRLAAERKAVLVVCSRAVEFRILLPFPKNAELLQKEATMESTATYDGPRRASSEVAKLVITDAQALPGLLTEMHTIDNRPVEGTSFELLPGRHRIGVTGTHDPHVGRATDLAIAGPVGLAFGTLADGFDATHSPVMDVCFVSSPGHTYEVRAFVESGLWRVQVFDQSSTYAVQSPCKPK